MTLMRYLHYEADQICEYVRSLGLWVTKCEFKNRAPAMVVDVTAIDEMLRQSEILWGTALPYYLTIANTIEAEPVPLADAVTRAEGTSATDHFLIIAYQDYGLISVSGAPLTFQKGARAAEWWRPYKSATSSPIMAEHRTSGRQ